MTNWSLIYNYSTACLCTTNVIGQIVGNTVTKMTLIPRIVSLI